MRQFIRNGVIFSFILLTAVFSFAGSITAAPATALDIADVTTSEADCFFDGECAFVPDNLTAGFTPTGMTGAGFLQSGVAPRGEVGTAGAGLYPYLYRVDLRDLDTDGNPACVTGLEIDFGPIVPLDYDDDGAVEHLFAVTDGAGGASPPAADLSGDVLTLDFSPAICGSFPGEDGQSSVLIGLASPFRYRETTAGLDINVQTELWELDTRAPAYEATPTLFVTPSNGRAGQTVQLIGSGYVPGDYEGTVRWDGADDAVFDIPSGGAFTISYTIPIDAALGDHTITTCSLNPCATGEFEQLASAPFAVTAVAPPTGAHLLYLPTLTRDEPPMSPAPFSYAVDGGVSPFQDELPGLNPDDPPRPLAAVQSPEGGVATFVSNELVLQTDDETAVTELLNRVNGKILLEIDPADAGIGDMAKTYLIRADLNTADTGELAADVNALIPAEIESAGEFLFSDQDGTRIFALAASEAGDGAPVGINWVSETADVTAVPTDSDEAPNGPDWGGVVYDPDAYTWPFMARGTTQDIGAPEAWNLLHNAGRLSNRVQVAVLDGGFYPNSDFPGGLTYISVVPFVTDPRNVDGADDSAPYHGTDVLQTVAARADNDTGIVGVATPVVDPIAVYTSYDYVVSIAAVLAARGAGADIINMSYSANVPSVFGWTVLPFEAATDALRDDGMLLFASAGNDGDNVDGEHCFIGCWEHTWHTPCENDGVTCVGGLGWDSRSRAGNSNFGSEHVDIFAPYTIYRGESPGFSGGDSTAGIINGTSFSSPYAASVAALVWAGDPSLSADEVWQIMRDTAHTSPDSRVNRYVNAYDAVLEAVGVGVDAAISSPGDGGTYDLNLPVTLFGRVGYVASADGAPVRIQWFDDATGASLYDVTRNPGAGAHTLYAETGRSDFSEGDHTLRLRVTAGDAVAEDTVTITIENSPPIADIDQPSSGSSFCPGETVTLRGSAFDVNEIGGLSDSAFAWRSDLDGNLGTGATLSVSTLSEGDHIITLRVTDPQGASDEESIGLTILSASDSECLDLDPTALIDSPENNDSFDVTDFDSDAGRWYVTVDFEGTVGDTEDDIADLTVAWESDLQGSLGTPSVNPSTGVTTISSDMYAFDPCGSIHTITLRVEDSAGNVTEDQIDIIITSLCQ